MYLAYNVDSFSWMSSYGVSGESSCAGNGAGLIFLFSSEKWSPQRSVEQNYSFKDQKDHHHIWTNHAEIKEICHKKGTIKRRRLKNFQVSGGRRCLHLFIHHGRTPVCWWTEAKQSFARSHDFGPRFFSKMGWVRLTVLWEQRDSSSIRAIVTPERFPSLVLQDTF